MTIQRNPVIDPGSRRQRLIPPPLPCMRDPSLRPACRAAQERHTHTGRPWFSCPHATRPNTADSCWTTSYLFPRKKRERGGRVLWHYHQGIDIAGVKGVSEIQAVAAGRVSHVVRAPREMAGFGGYGKVVVIEGDDGFHYMHAHCDSVAEGLSVGDSVAEQQIIAKVGCTMWDGGDITSVLGDGAAHLHFEVSERPYPMPARLGNYGESTLEDPSVTRSDPRVRLEALGPWGPKKLYFPILLGEESKERHEVTDDRRDSLFRVTEREIPGGHFPLGANTIWHGGVHLPGEEGDLVRAPFDGQVVAVRLDPDPARANRHFGSSNFILIRHEVPDAILRRLAARGGSSGAAARRDRERVGEYRLAEADRPRDRRGRPRRPPTMTNPPDLVVEIKAMLHELGTYEPTDEALLEDGDTVDEAFVQAILSFQAAIQSSLRRPFPPDGVISVPGTTYDALQQRAREHREARQSAGGDSAAAQPNLLYSLFMHLGPEELNDAFADRIPWLGSVSVPPTDEEARAQRAAQQAAEREREQDGEDLGYRLTGDVGPPPAEGARRRRRRTRNAEADVSWVQRRLRRHGYLETEPTGTWSDALGEAIRRFQAERVSYFRDHADREPDAEVSRGGGSYDALKQTTAELSAEPGAQGGHARLAARCGERTEAGLAPVITELTAQVHAGDPIWTLGLARAFNAPASEGESGEGGESEGESGEDAPESTLQPMLHWELFSPAPLVGRWERIDDDEDRDMTLDVASLIEQVEGVEISRADGGEARDGRLSRDEVESFYESDRCHALRTTQVRFCSEWGLDLEATLSALREAGWNTRGLGTRLRPYLWWSAAQGAVPDQPLVWHYNPVAFMHHYLDQYPRAPVTPPAPTADDEPAWCGFPHNDPDYSPLCAPGEGE